MEIKHLTDRLAVIVFDPNKPRSRMSNRLRYKLLNNKGLNKCEQCGISNKLEAHHIEKIKYLISKGGFYYQDPKADHSLNNGRLLCRNCHLKLHNTK